jgi:hypothetical protein
VVPYHPCNGTYLLPHNSTKIEPSEAFPCDSRMASSPEPKFSAQRFMSRLDEVVAEPEEQQSMEALLNLSASDYGENDVSFDNETDHSEEIIVAESATSGGEKHVSFMGMEGPSPPAGLDLTEASREELIARIGSLQDKLTEAQVSLKKEKGSKRRKEKNTLKLAAELGRQQITVSQKEKDIAKLSEMLTSMELKLQKASELEKRLRHAIAGYKKKLSKFAPGDSDDDDLLRWEEISSSEVTSPRHGRVDRRKLVPSWEIALSVFLCLALVSVQLILPGFFKADGYCAPVMPGTHLKGHDLVASPPWWLPSDMKVAGFHLFCKGHKRVHVRVESGTLYLQQNESGKVKTLERVDSVQSAKFLGTKVIVEGRKGSRTIIPAPWVE